MALTVTERFTEVFGPRKRETIVVSSDATEASATTTSLLANPQRASVVGVNGTATPTDLSANVTSGSRTITVNNPNVSENYRITVEGF